MPSRRRTDWSRLACQGKPGKVEQSPHQPLHATAKRFLDASRTLAEA
ncbi:MULTISPECIES: hypothetical protein [unclassified Streptomyces]|nr:MULTISPECIES: hypothetical protein [unclassified Streptomyces]WPO70848.1 hypothetical protein R9806_09520 [Streptomyces sp. KN37]